MFTPKLHFYYAYPFDAGRRRLYAEKGMVYPSYEEVAQKVSEYRTLWEEININDTIMQLIVESTGVTLPRDLEVWVFGAGMSAMSSPFLLPAFRKDGAAYTNDQLKEIIIHEMLHRFVGFPENNKGIAEYWAAFRTEYAVEHVTAQNHVLIYAYLEVILTKLYGKEKVEEMIAPHSPEYKRAVEIVKAKGAEGLISQFRSFLK